MRDRRVIIGVAMMVASVDNCWNSGGC